MVCHLVCTVWLIKQLFAVWFKTFCSVCFKEAACRFFMVPDVSVTILGWAQQAGCLLYIWRPGMRTLELHRGATKAGVHAGFAPSAMEKLGQTDAELSASSLWRSPPRASLSSSCPLSWADPSGTTRSSVEGVHGHTTFGCTESPQTFGG